MHKKRKQIVIFVRKKIQPHHFYFLKLSFLYLCGVLLFISMDMPNFFSEKKALPHKVLAEKTVNQAKLVNRFLPTPTLTVTPTLIPTSTPTPTSILRQVPDQASGFCLHVPVVYYHHIQPLDIASKLGHAQLTVDSAIFDQQVSYLVSAGYQTISADDLVHALLTHQQLPGKSIVLTFDDGYDDIYSFAYPILKKYNAVGNLMIPTGLLNNPGYLTWGQLKEMSGNKLIHVYNHTWSHASLGGASKDKIESEVTTASTQLQSNLSITVDVFAYPYGSYSSLAIQILREHNFTAAFTTVPGSWQCDSELMTLPRIRIGNAPMRAYGF